MNEPEFPDETLAACCGPDLPRCLCSPVERALRSWEREDPGMPEMNPEQREWCLGQIDAIEGHSREGHQDSNSRDLAHAVLVAWIDFCRDKGLLT